jgi:hypothetical protein
VLHASRSGRTRSGAPRRVRAFRDLFHQLPVEGRNIIRASTGDQTLIDDNFSVFPFRIRVSRSVCIDDTG